MGRGMRETGREERGAALLYPWRIRWDGKRTCGLCPREKERESLVRDMHRERIEPQSGRSSAHA